MDNHLERKELVRAVRMFVHYEHSIATCDPVELPMRKKRKEFYKDILIFNLVRDDVIFDGCGGRDSDYTYVTNMLDAW